MHKFSKALAIVASAVRWENRERGSMLSTNDAILLEAQDKLKAQAWFGASSPVVQELVLDLKFEAIGLLEHLANRPIVGGGVEIIALQDFLYPEGMLFGVLVNFLVRNTNTGAEYRYQYFVWRQGPKSGAKFVVLVKKGDEITGLICLKGFSFAVGGETYDSVGGFGEVTDDSVIGFMAKRNVVRELQEELGIDEVMITETIGLGAIYPDRGMTPNHPDIYAIVVDGETADLTIGHENDDPWEMNAQSFYVPIERLWGPDGFIQVNDDGFFLGIVARLVGRGIIRQPIAL